MALRTAFFALAGSFTKRVVCLCCRSGCLSVRGSRTREIVDPTALSFTGTMGSVVSVLVVAHADPSFDANQALYASWSPMCASRLSSLPQSALAMAGFLPSEHAKHAGQKESFLNVTSHHATLGARRHDSRMLRAQLSGQHDFWRGVAVQLTGVLVSFMHTMQFQTPVLAMFSEIPTPSCCSCCLCNAPYDSFKDPWAGDLRARLSRLPVWCGSQGVL